MGAASAIMALSKNNNGVLALIADSSFAKLSEIIHRKSHVLTPFIIKFMNLKNVDVTKSQPINYVDKLSMPVFFIHGDQDTLVSSEDSRCLFEKAKEPKELWIVKGGEHGRSYFVDKKEYSKRILDFLNRYF